MTLSRTTWILLAASALLALLLLLPSSRHSAQESLPELPAVELSEVTRVQFVRQGQTTVLERQGDIWQLLQPLQAQADTTTVKSLLRNFREPVPMDLRLDEGNLEDYALDDSNGVTVEVFTGGDEPVISMVVGNDLPGGSSLIRLAGSEQVYRARVGGRFRYDKKATEWRNRTLLSLDPDQVAGITLERPEDVLVFTREPSGETDDEGNAVFGPWELDGQPLFIPDQRTLDALARTLSHMRASELHASDYGEGWDNPDVVAEVALSDGTIHRMAIVPAGEQAALARVDERPDVHRISASHLKRFTWPLVEFRDKTIFSFTRDQVDSIALEEGGHRVRIEQDLEGRQWRVTEPVNMEADLRKSLYTANSLASLRALRVVEGVDLASAGLDAPRTRFVIEMSDGNERVLEAGAGFQDESGEAIYVRRDGQMPVYAMRAEALVRLRQAFLKN